MNTPNEILFFKLERFLRRVANNIKYKRLNKSSPLKITLLELKIKYVLGFSIKTFLIEMIINFNASGKLAKKNIAKNILNLTCAPKKLAIRNIINPSKNTPNSKRNKAERAIT